MPAPVFRSSRWLAAALACATASTAGAAPTVANDSYSVNVNASLTVPVGSGLLANDTGFNASTHRLESSDEFSQFGGRVTVAADGSFSYQPVPGFRGLDSFQYTVRDATGASTAQVTIDVSGATVWFVDDSAPAGGNGTRSAPFNSFAPVNGASGAGDVDAVGDTIFVFAGTYDVTFDLESAQRLIGEGAGLDLIGTASDVPAGTRPLISSSNGFPLIELFGTNGIVRAFNIANSGGRAISGTTVGAFRLEDISITSAAASSGSIEFIGTTGVNTIQNVAITGSAVGPALSFINNAGSIDLVGSTVSAFTVGRVLLVSGNSGAVSFDSSSDLSSSNTAGLEISTMTATGVVTLAGVNLTGGAAGGPLVDLLNNHASSVVNFEEGVVASSTATNSHAFSASGGKIKIAGTNSTLSATDGAALDFDAIELTQNATFVSLSSTSSASQGIRVGNPVGAFDIAVTGTTTISTPTTAAISIDDSVSPSGFSLNLATFNSSGGTFGIQVIDAAIAVSNNASTLTTSAGPAIVCETSVTSLALATLTAAGGGNGVSFDGCSGTVTAAAGSLNSTTGAVVNLVNTSGTSAVNFTYGGTINKTTAGAAVNILGLTGAGGAVTFNGTVTASNASGGVSIISTTRPVGFTTLNLGTSGARFATTPITLANNTGAVSLGNVSIFTNGATGLSINYANASPGQVSTGASSVLNVTGNFAALVVDHATSQPVALQFASITNTGAGSHGIFINRATGALVVTGLTDIGAKTTAGILISNSNNFTTSLQEVDITGAFDGVRLSDNTGSSSFDIMGDGNFSTSHTNGFGGTFSNLGDNAFDFTNVANFRATDVTVSGTGSHGVTGKGVSGTTVFSNVDFTNIGNADNEHVFNFREGETSGAQVSGSLEINNSIIENFTDNGVYLENFSGTLDFRFTDNTLRNNITTTACGGGNCNGNGILLRADGTSRINALILNTAFEDIDGVGLSANPEGSSGARMDINVAQSAFTAEPYGGASHTNNGETAISLRNAQGNSTLNFRLFSNDIRNYTGELALGVVEIEGGDFTTTNGVIDVLYIYHAHEGNGLQIFSDGANTAGSGTTNFTMNVSMNGVNVPAPTPIFGASILLQNNGAISGSTVNSNFTVTGSNLLANATGSGRRTLTMNARDFNNVCNNISGNTIAAGSGGTQASVNLSYNGSGAVRLQGMTGIGDTNAIARLVATNTLSVAAISGPNNNITSATCTTPTIPVAFPFN